MKVRDTGQWRSPGNRSGGRGLPLMEELADELTIDRQAESTTVTMVRELPPAGPETTTLCQ
jgi:anti-sigma regulatory factor (Ser/Thr protein kinase)